MEYTGEHIPIGQVGNVFVILAFVFALLASISYFFAARDNDASSSWKMIGRWAYRIHGISVFGIVGTLFWMLYNHYFEYEYVWHHSSKAMPMRYILSCFWEGQEGSFLLWTFWHVVIGFILQRKAKEWEAPVLSVIALVQTFLTSMLLGIVLKEQYYIGRNPFTVLLRNHPDYAGIPLFSNPNYLAQLDGRGLNPLLQNYWMTIHPPTLFLGFALTVVPFAYAIAGLWKKKYTEWLKPALPWTFLGVAILGVGILMGGAWAYEALSFGGFWAWDPVENASLVPWLTLVGAAHLMLINRNKGQSLFTAFGLSILTFILILYSTFLTRSGILGETSVHAFQDLGMSGQLLIYLFVFLFMGILLLLVDRTYQVIYSIASVLFIFILWLAGPSSFTISGTGIPYRVLIVLCWIIFTGYYFAKSSARFFPQAGKEESIFSREFWMFVGAIILLVSSFQIMFYTSLPVWNKLFNMHKAPATDIKQFYNSWQLPFAFLTTLLIAIGQYFKYKDTDTKEFVKKITLPLVIAAAGAVLIAYGLHYTNFLFIALLFSTLFAIFANMDYARRVFGGRIMKAGASIAHVGFAMVLLGALISTSKEDVISQNTSGKSVESLGKDYSNRENILLTQGDTLPMGRYYVTYAGKRFEGINVYYDIDYFFKDANGRYEKQFRLSPLVQQNKLMGNAAEPDTRHFLTYDVYSHITYSVLSGQQDKDAGTSGDEYTAAKNYSMEKGDTTYSSNAMIILDSLSTQFDKSKYDLKPDDISVMAHFSVLDIAKRYEANPVYMIRDNDVQPIPAKVDSLGLQLMFWKIHPETGKIDISVQEKKSNIREFIVMKAMIFPYINVLWTGCIIMAIGTLISIRARIRKPRKNAAEDRQEKVS